MEEGQKRRRVGPSLDDLVDEEVEEVRPSVAKVVVGPSLAGGKAEEMGAARLREAEAREWQRMREKKAKEERPEREEWMTALPEGKRQDALQYFRGGKSQFSGKGMQGDVDKAWARAPHEKGEEGEEDLREAQERMEERKAREISEQIQRYNEEERPESLMELHHKEDKDKKKKKKKKKKDKKKKDKKRAAVTPLLGAMEVGTWNREQHMKGSVVTTERKIDTLNHASKLAGRFASGKF